MVGVNFFGNFDLASLSIWLFWLFFALLIYYLQTENMREGYPLEDEDGNAAANQGPFPVPAPKTRILPHGGGEWTVPSQEVEDAHRRTGLALERTSPMGGYPMRPTGDPMADGVGPASWAVREDKPELDGKGYPKIVPMSSHDNFMVSAGRDPRGLPVMGRDKEVAGTVSDLWIDEPEQLVRYIEIDVDGAGKRLVPIQLAVIKRGHVMVRSLVKERFAGIPALKSDKQITKLEEDKVSAYVAAGSLYGAGTEPVMEVL
ncbi:MAG: photosynthetic reaction center subunit H [Paracoccaceae bacterium]|jgi:photosynthetic reaction center H subunit|nr:photosynthetic reaction center subunit H [Paracoccaceae bacterium]